MSEKVSPSQSHPSDSPSLLHLAADGDQDAIAECITRFAPVVYTIAKRQLQDEAQAYELTLDVFSELWQNLHEFDPTQQDEKTFTALLARRKLAEFDKRHASESDVASKPPPEWLSSDRKALEQQVAHKALVEGKSADVIAHELGTDEAQVKTLAHTVLLRARAKLIKRTITQ